MQINLLSEQKLAKLVALLEELRRDIPMVPNRYDAVAHAMTKAVDPRAVILALEETFEAKDPPTDEPNKTAPTADDSIPSAK